MQRTMQLKRQISLNDARLKEKHRSAPKKKEDITTLKAISKTKTSSALFFEYNTQLGPPYHVIVDTNFINFSIKNKLDIFKNMLECLYAKCIPYITDCVFGELETLGHKSKLALRIIKDPRFQRLSCVHKGIYADNCIVQRVTEHRCYIVATNDKELKRRIRQISGVPIMYASKIRYVIERMPDALEPISK